MIFITIPITELSNGSDNTVVQKEVQLPVEIDTSFNAHLKWEENFQSIKNIDLSSMITIVDAWVKDPKEASKHMPDILRVLYCFVNSDKLPTFSHFVKVLNQNNFTVFIDRISTVIAEVGKSATKN